jgi:hypothetical protein
MSEPQTKSEMTLAGASFPPMMVKPAKLVYEFFSLISIPFY